MTTEHDALVRAICEAPDDDTPRLVYADWLDENASGSDCARCFEFGGRRVVRNPNPRRGSSAIVICPTCSGTGRATDGRRELAEFIRVQIQLAHDDAEDAANNRMGTNPLRSRQRELFEKHAASWVPVPTGYTLSVALADASGAPVVNASYARHNVKVTGDMRFYFGRGFCSEWWAALEDFVGWERECPSCIDGPVDWETGVVECRRCESTGVTGEAGHAETVFRAHPIVRTHVTDQSPDMVTIHDGTDRWVWRRWPDADTREILPGYLPGFVFDHDSVSGDFLGGRSGTAFGSRESAEDGLSARLVAMGRDLAGLPLLAMKAAA